jgi:hypothetical protein
MMTIACYLVLTHVPFIHNFGSITTLSFDHIPDTGVPKNNRFMLSKSQTKTEGKQVKN